MVTMSTYTQGQFCWIDLMSRVMSGAKPFYCNLFGWQAVDQDTHGGPPYACFTLDDQQVAGMGQMNDEMKASGQPPVWNSYINVDDVQAATNQAAELGAQVVMPPFQVVDAGHMSIRTPQEPSFLSGKR